MLPQVQSVIGLVALVAAATLLARRWQLPTSIVLVVVGLLLSFVPGLPELRLDPGLTLLVVLPPLVYSAGVVTSWPEFRRDIAPITLLAVGAVLFTTVLVAAIGHFVAGLPWGPALLLGAVISPPDVIAPMTVVGRIRIPRRVATILNGEGLVNDVTALVLVGIATAAVAEGAFSPARAAGTFALVLAGELAWGLAVGWATLRVRRWAADTRVEITVSLLTPYLCFWLPHALGGSGVLATAAAGLYTSWVGPRLISAATRLQGTFFWNLTVYLLTGLVFLFTGLQARSVLSGIAGGGWTGLLGQAAAVCGVAVAARFAWVFALAWLSPLWSGEVRPGWRSSFLLGFTGIRGVVSLVAALSIPLQLADGQPFPGRDLIVALTFAVIVATLVAQGLALPPLIRRLRLDEVGTEELHREDADEIGATIDVETRAIEALDREAARLRLSDEVRRDLLARHEGRRRRAEEERADPDAAARGAKAELALISAQRGFAWERFAADAITDESRRRIEHELDLEEARIRRDRGEAIADGT